MCSTIDVRWAGQELTTDDGALPGLELPALRTAGLIRTVRAPEFDGVTFHEVVARSALSKVPAASRMPFRWTVNPYRGCSHACRYCYARGSHTYLDLDAGADFDSQVVVKVNVDAVLRAELAKPSWGHESVALGTNTDPYQRAEGRYRLMPGIISALADSRTPFSILTKGTLLRRDLPLLADAAERVEVGVGVSLAFADEDLQQRVEPGTPTPRARLALIRAIREAGLPCGVMVAPVLPWLTDSRDHLARLLDAVAEAGATGATVLPLHLRPGAREWYLDWLRREFPQHAAGYRRVFGDRSYVDRRYQEWLWTRVEPLLAERGLGRAAFRFDGGAATGGGAAGDGSAAGDAGGPVPDGEGAYPAGAMPAAASRSTGPAAPATEAQALLF